MNLLSVTYSCVLSLLCFTVFSARPKKPNIILIVADDTGYGDLGVYGGGAGRGMATPNLDKMAREGMQFWSFYGQPSCTPGRAAMQTGRNPNRSGMTTVAFQGQGGGLPAAEWTVASVLKNAGYNTYFSGKWHLGEDASAMPIAHGYDIMDNVILYHLNAYTFSWSDWYPEMTPEVLAYYEKVTIGRLRGVVGSPAVTIGDVTRENIAELDFMMTNGALKQLENYAQSAKPFFMSLNFAKTHQPSVPSVIGGFEGISAAKSKFADCVVEVDHYVGQVMDKIMELGLGENTLVFYTVDNGAWQDVFPDAGYTPFRGTKGTDREGGVRVPALAWWPGQIAAGSQSHDIVGGLDFMATFAALAEIQLPSKDRAGEPIYFDSLDMANVLFDEGKPLRSEWYYFTEFELSPGAIRLGKFKAQYNLRGDNGAVASSDLPGHELGWRGADSYIAVVPRIYDLWQDPQERYDLFMNNFVEKTWTMVFFNMAYAKILQTYVDFPPRKMQSEAFSGPMTINKFRGISAIKKFLESKIPKMEVS